MAFKYRAYPTRPQERYINECIHSCWWFYRYVLHQYEDDYRQAKQNYQNEVLSYYDGNVTYHPFWFQRKSGKVKIPKEFYPLGAPIRHQGSKLVVRYDENGTKSLIPLSYFKDSKRNLSPLLSNEEIIDTSTYKFLQKARTERPHLQDIPAVVMQEVLERVAHAFDKFWKEGGGYPNYPKERNYSSVTWTSGIEIFPEEQLLKVSKIPGLLKIVYHRPIKGKIKRANISKDILGRYYVSLMCEFDDNKEVIAKEHIVGIDMNIKAIDIASRLFITLSNGEKVDIPRWNTQYEEKLARIQRKIAKTELGSKEWRKYNRHIKHIYDDIQNKKDYWLHNLTRDLANKYEYVAIEDMDLTTFHKKRGNPEEATNMELAGDRGQRKAWTETPFGEFKRQLQYKLGEKLIKVNPAYTSQDCNCCGERNTKLTRSDRVWKCPSCGEVLDRDINAAKNIRDIGIIEIKNQQEKKE
jgi:putative transposase